MNSTLMPEISSSYVTNLGTPRVLPQECYRIPSGRNSPTIACAPQEVPLGYDLRLASEYFSHNLLRALGVLRPE